MPRHLHLILAFGMALGIGACATSRMPPPSTVQGAPGEGFTNSRLRTALYQWPAENVPVKTVCLRNSLVIFTLLQECGGGEGTETAGGELVFRDCIRSNDERTASFLVRTAGSEPWEVAVRFSETRQQFSLSATPSGTTRK